jgi:hypothetical protein
VDLVHGSPSSLHSALQALEAICIVYNGQSNGIPTMFRDQTAGKAPNVVTTAIACELAGFVWAIARQAQPAAT